MHLLTPMPLLLQERISLLVRAPSPPLRCYYLKDALSVFDSCRRMRELLSGAAVSSDCTSDLVLEQEWHRSQQVHRGQQAIC